MKNKGSNKQKLFEMMHKINGMSLNENTDIPEVDKYNFDEWVEELNVPDEVKDKIEFFVKDTLNKVKKGMDDSLEPLKQLGSLNFDRMANPNQEKTPINNRIIEYIDNTIAQLVYDNYHSFLNLDSDNKYYQKYGDFGSHNDY